jgi:hypothetical protein
LILVTNLAWKFNRQTRQPITHCNWIGTAIIGVLGWNIIHNEMETEGSNQHIRNSILIQQFKYEKYKLWWTPFQANLIVKWKKC